MTDSKENHAARNFGGERLNSLLDAMPYPQVLEYTRARAEREFLANIVDVSAPKDDAIGMDMHYDDLPSVSLTVTVKNNHYTTEVDHLNPSRNSHEVRELMAAGKRLISRHAPLGGPEFTATSQVREGENGTLQFTYHADVGYAERVYGDSPELEAVQKRYAGKSGAELIADPTFRDTAEQRMGAPLSAEQFDADNTFGLKEMVFEKIAGSEIHAARAAATMEAMQRAADELRADSQKVKAQIGQTPS